MRCREAKKGRFIDCRQDVRGLAPNLWRAVEDKLTHWQNSRASRTCITLLGALIIDAETHGERKLRRNGETLAAMRNVTNAHAAVALFGGAGGSQGCNRLCPLPRH
jgi:hypothetical protein